MRGLLQRREQGQSADTSEPKLSSKRRGGRNRGHSGRQESHSDLRKRNQPLPELQRVHGNRTVQRLVKERLQPTLQSKLAVGRPDDRYEREADRVAERVMRTPTSESAGDLGETDAVQSGGYGSQTRMFESQAGASKTDDESLSPSLRSFFEPRFGRDLSAVRLHTGPDSVRLNRALGARAFTHGRDIYLGPGEQSVRSTSGKRLLAHELTHAVQQGASDELRRPESGVSDRSIDVRHDSRPAIQRLIKEPAAHPWTGLVVNTPSLALRDAPRGNTLADLPSDTLVEVLSATGNWLNLEVDVLQPGIVLNSRARQQLSDASRSYTSSVLSGFSYHTYVDDAVAAEMTRMVGERATWVPSGPGPGNTFANWASAPSESAAPPVETATTINCWEMVLLAGYRIGAVGWRAIHDLYTSNPDPSQWTQELITRLTPANLTEYDSSTAGDLQRGDIVFFDGAAHVTLATGNGDEVLTFWPPPNTQFTRGGTVDAVKTSTISELKDWMETNLTRGVPVKVTFGPPRWSAW